MATRLLNRVGGLILKHNSSIHQRSLAAQGLDRDGHRHTVTVLTEICLIGRRQPYTATFDTPMEYGP
jgi:hypothetical protein